MHACIDLGSNSFHLLIGEWEDENIKIVERLSEKVQLGENVGRSGKISPAAFERGVNCLRRFKILMRQYPLEQYWALGTNTFRIASNTADFIEAAKQIGIDISVITGVQEAVLIYAGVISDLPLSDRHRLVIDIGGGSTEVIVGSHHDRLLTESLPIGSVAWRDRFFSDAFTGINQIQAAMDRAKSAAEQGFALSAPAVRKAGWLEAHASSGTVKMLANISHGLGYPAGEISLQGLQEMQHKLAETIMNNGNLSGLKEARRDLLLPGWSVLTGLMTAYKVDQLRFSATALREGMLDFMVKNEKTLDAMTRSNLPDISFAKH